MSISFGGMMKQLEYMTEPELRNLMNTLAGSIEFMCKELEVEKPLFVLVLFNDPKIGQYVSNCERSTIIEAMREVAERLEKKQDIVRE